MYFISILFLITMKLLELKSVYIVRSLFKHLNVVIHLKKISFRINYITLNYA